MIKLSPEISRVLGANPFDTLMTMRGEVYRQQGNRETLRVWIDHQPYFMKRYVHEIFKAGAKSEWEALRLCDTLGVSVPALKGFGARGTQSFVLMEDLVEAESLENITVNWAQKNTIIKKLAMIARTLHQKGYYHRDFYLCHFFWDSKKEKLSLIDLHRLFRPRFFKKHYQVKDLSGLFFSAMDMNLRRRDVFLFLRHYFNIPLRDVLKTKSHLLAMCEKKAIALYQKAYHQEPRHVSWLSHRADWAQQVGPFHHVYLLNGKLFESDACLRVLGERRMVLSGMYDGQRRVVKFFSEMRDYDKECAGGKQLNSFVGTVPNLHCLSGSTGDFSLSNKKIAWVMYPYLPGHPPVALTHDLLRVIADLHHCALIQTDPHLDNFRISDGKIYVLDPASVQSTHSNEKMLDNLALFYAQWPRSMDDAHLSLLSEYFVARGAKWSPDMIQSFVARLSRIRAYNLKKWLSKICRDSTAFYAKSRINLRVYAKRAFANVYTQTLMRFPDAYFHEGALFLKQGRSNTVVRVMIGEQDVVIKRYNLKSFLHLVKGLFRGSKAKRAWRNTQLCQSLGILTPEPLAMIEKRCCYFPLTSYLVTAYASGTRLDHMPVEELTPEVCKKMAFAIQQTFSLFSSVQCYHGDLKASNWIWDGEGMQLIDLDSLRQIKDKDRFDEYHEKDKSRFLRNFDLNHPLRAMLF